MRVSIASETGVGNRGSLVCRFLIASAALVVVRGGLVLGREASGFSDIDGRVLAGAVRFFPIDLALSLAGLALAWALLRMLGGRLRFPIASACALLAFAHASFRFPRTEVFVPPFATSPLANGLVGLIVALAVWIALGGKRVPFERPLAGLAGIVLAAGIALGFAGRTPPASWPERPNLVLVSLDTLRPDHLSCYGYELETSPELDRFAASAVRFDRAYSPQAWTLTAHMTMLTSLQPFVHGVTHGKSLSPAARTLAGELAGAGYRTLAVVDDCMWLAEHWGFARGFDLYYRVGRPAAFKVDQILSLLDINGPQPFFLFAHFFDAHSDVDRLQYDAGEEDLATFASWYEGDFDGCDEEGRCASRFLKATNRLNLDVPEETRRYITSLYDAGIRSLDRELGRLLRGLEERGLLETSAVLITADHGEELWDHGQVLHGQGYDECLRVPFLLRTPGTDGGVSRATVSLSDVMPTLLDLAGLDLAGLQGRSLAPVLAGATLPDVAVPTSTTDRVTGLRDGDTAILFTESGIQRFDTRADPRQAHDLGTGADEQRALRDLEAGMDSLRSLLGPRADGRRLSASEREALEDLGYLGD